MGAETMRVRPNTSIDALTQQIATMPRPLKLFFVLPEPESVPEAILEPGGEAERANMFVKAVLTPSAQGPRSHRALLPADTGVDDGGGGDVRRGMHRAEEKGEEVGLAGMTGAEASWFQDTPFADTMEALLGTGDDDGSSAGQKLQGKSSSRSGGKRGTGAKGRFQVAPLPLRPPPPSIIPGGTPAHGDSEQRWVGSWTVIFDGSAPLGLTLARMGSAREEQGDARFLVVEVQPGGQGESRGIRFGDEVTMCCSCYRSVLSLTTVSFFFLQHFPMPTGYWT